MGMWENHVKIGDFPARDAWWHRRAYTMTYHDSNFYRSWPWVGTPWGCLRFACATSQRPHNRWGWRRGIIPNFVIFPLENRVIWLTYVSKIASCNSSWTFVICRLNLWHWRGGRSNKETKILSTSGALIYFLICMVLSYFKGANH
jgi:hypothetical protein